MNRRLFAKLCLGAASSPLFAMEKPKEQKNETKIFLTVDDGWHYKKTILEIADHYRVPLNMFIIGKIIEEDPAIWQKAIEKGHMLGSHSQHHHKFSKTDKKIIVNDFREYKKCVVNTLGKESFEKIKYFRFPYGDRGKGEVKNVAEDIITDNGWLQSWWTTDLSFSSNGYGVKAFKSPQDQLRKFASNVKPINVPLFHFKDPDVRALELVIQYGLSKGYKFCRLDSEKHTV